MQPRDAAELAHLHPPLCPAHATARGRRRRAGWPSAAHVEAQHREREPLECAARVGALEREPEGAWRRRRGWDRGGLRAAPRAEPEAAWPSGEPPREQHRVRLERRARLGAGQRAVPAGRRTRVNRAVRAGGRVSLQGAAPHPRGRDAQRCLSQPLPACDAEGGRRPVALAIAVVAAGGGAASPPQRALPLCRLR